MLIVGVLEDSTLQNALVRAFHYANRVDVFELRIDCLSHWECSDIANFQLHIAKPLIFSLRSIKQGGRFVGSKTQQIAQLHELAALAPAYLEVEYTIPEQVIEKIHDMYPSLRLIRSFYDYLATPHELTSLLQTLIHPACCIIKLVTMAQSSRDCLRMLNVLQCVNVKRPRYDLVAYCMGEKGVPSQILGAALGNFFTYGHLPEPIAATDQIDVDTLLNLYNLQQLNFQTRFFALLGDPVAQSVGHIFHNVEFKKRGINCVYVKFEVNADELPLFIESMKSLPFRGLSITTPLKQAIMPLLDHLQEQDKALGAINTVCVTRKGLYGSNTDGIGAIRALEVGIGEMLTGHLVILLGAGSAATAIAFAAAHRRGRIIIINRTLIKAQQLAKRIQDMMTPDISNTPQYVQSYDFSTFSEVKLNTSCILINALPAAIKLPDHFLAQLSNYDKVCLFDINYYHPNSALVEIANQHDWQRIDGIEMFYEQALEQLAIWAGSPIGSSL